QGTFHTAQIYVYDFNGSFRGSGANKTVIANLPNLYVTRVDTFLNPPSAANPVPFLFNFLDGQFVIADLAVHIAAHDGNITTGWEQPLFDGSGVITIYEMVAAIVIAGTQA